MAEKLSDVVVGGLAMARMHTKGLLDNVFDALDQGKGGWIVTVNLDFLRMASENADTLALYREADIRVADGRLVVLATRLAGHAVPEQIAGSSLVWPLAERAHEAGRSLYLLGGAPGAAEMAAEKLRARWPTLRIGLSCPWVTCPPVPEQLEPTLEDARKFGADIVLVGLGSPKQEHVIHWLRPHLPRAWMMGVGVTLSFVAGMQHRAPVWMQHAYLEWAHRLSQEPRRLAGRYLLHDAPYALQLFARAAAMRIGLLAEETIPAHHEVEDHDLAAADGGSVAGMDAPSAREEAENQEACQSRITSTHPSPSVLQDSAAAALATHCTSPT